MNALENNYFKTIKELPIENFYEILNSDNYNFLRKNIGEHNFDDFPMHGDDFTILSSTWLDIHESYVDGLGKGDGGKDYMILAEISELQLEISIVATLCHAHQHRPLKALEIEIRRWGYNPDDLEKAQKKLKGIEFRISIIKSKNPDIFDVTDKEELEKIEYDLYKDVVSLEESLGNGKTIDVKTTVVARWVNYIKLSEAKSKRIKNMK